MHSRFSIIFISHFWVSGATVLFLQSVQGQFHDRTSCPHTCCLRPVSDSWRPCELLDGHFLVIFGNGAQHLPDQFPGGAFLQTIIVCKNFFAQRASVDFWPDFLTFFSILIHNSSGFFAESPIFQPHRTGNLLDDIFLDDLDS